MENESNLERINSAKEQPEMEPQKENKRLWPVTFDQKGKVYGLPADVSPGDVILFERDDGTWWAKNPSPEIIEEIQKWRTDWDNIPQAEEQSQDKS